MYQRQVTVLVYLSFMLLGLLSILWGILLPDIMVQLQMSPGCQRFVFCLFVAGFYYRRFFRWQVCAEI